MPNTQASRSLTLSRAPTRLLLFAYQTNAASVVVLRVVFVVVIVIGAAAVDAAAGLPGLQFRMRLLNLHGSAIESFTLIVRCFWTNLTIKLTDRLNITQTQTPTHAHAYAHMLYLSIFA